MITTKDSLNAHMLQKLPKDSVVITHSAGNEDIYKANRINATTNTETKYYLVSVGSPIAESELRESTASVGAELVRQVNHPGDPVPGIFNSGERINYIKYLFGDDDLKSKFTTKGLNTYHPFESYYNNPDFQIKETIQNIFIEDAIKRINERRFIYDNNQL